MNVFHDGVGASQVLPKAEVSLGDDIGCSKTMVRGLFKPSPQTLHEGVPELFEPVTVTMVEEESWSCRRKIKNNKNVF